MSLFISLLCDTGTFVCFMYFFTSLYKNKSDFMIDDLKFFGNYGNNLFTMRIHDF